MISVIVPVFNQWHLVPQLLSALSVQATGDEFEVLLVDNGSDVVPEPDGEPPFVRRLLCKIPGSYAARNHGAANAKGDLFVFTDADCVPEADWLAALADCVTRQGGKTTIAAGRVKVVAEAPVTIAARYDMALGFPQEQYVSRGYGVTANLGMSRELFERAGGFDARRLSGGDAEFCRRALANNGADIIYCPAAVVVHPARRSLDELVRKVRRLKGGQLRSGPWFKRITNGLRGFLPPVRAWWRIWMAPDLGLLDRLAISMVQARLWLTEMAETLRLLAGNSAERR